MCYLCAKKLFPSSAPAENRLLGCGFVLVFHWCAKPINRCSLSRPLLIWVIDEVDLVLCGLLFPLYLFPVRYSLSTGWKWASRMCDCSIWGPKSFHNSGKETWLWQRTINNYHYNVSDTVLLHVIIPLPLSFLLILAWSTFYLHLPGGPD